ncbi:MAG: RNA polymerase sigma factor [Polyangiales bacterium]
MFTMALTDDVSALAIIARRLCGNSSDADDLVQDTLERALRARGKYIEQGNRRGWLAVILRNQFRDRYRSSRRRATDHEVDDIATPVEPEAPAWASITSEQIGVALAELDPRYRAVYELYARGWAYAEIARELDISINTVGTRLLRARAKLKAILNATSPVC